MLLVPLAVATDTWTEVATGVRLLDRTTSDPNHIYVAEIDLCADGVSLRASTSSERQQRTSSFADDVGATVAINGDFFSYDDYSTSGLAIGNGGAAWSDDTASEGFVAFGNDRAWISDPAEVWSTPADWMEEVVGGRPLLVVDGEPVGTYSTPSSCPSLNPHTAVGLSRDRQTLWLMVVDGRSSSSEGMTCSDEADLMADLGAWTALSLDGGGSSTMVVDGDIVNDPSDGSERTVANHLAVITGTGAPGSCDWWLDETILAGQVDGSTDVDGDGDADLCGRGPDGFVCALAPELVDTWSISNLADANGWSDESNYNSFRMADMNGDGRADLCARANAGVRCYLSNGAGFEGSLVGPELSDDVGWDDPKYATTLQFADVTGDGRDDLCARSSAGFGCWPSLGTAFGEQQTAAPLSNASGWGDPAYYGTIRLGDIDGDGRADMCARAAAGVLCWLADDTGFVTQLSGPTWSDDAGWGEVSAWSTIRMVDIDGDSRADLCGRGPDGVECALSTGSSFGSVFSGPGMTDASGWGDHDNYDTLRFGDVDGDGDADLCARANASVYCWLYDASAFATRIDGPELSDDAGWTRARYYSTLRLGDLDGDGKADLCARASAGIRCYRSTGTGFEAAIVGPEWSDALGWDDVSTFSTIRFGGGSPPQPEDTAPVAEDTASDSADDGAEDSASQVPRARVASPAGCGGGAGVVGAGVRRRAEAHRYIRCISIILK